MNNPRLSIPRKTAAFRSALTIASIGLTLDIAAAVLQHSLPDPIADTPASSENQATIILKRRLPLFDNGKNHYVVDRGDRVAQNAIVVERSSFPETAANFCDPGNIVYLSSIPSSPTAGSSVDQSFLSVIIGDKLRADLAPNASLIGRFDSHGVLKWTRPPGRMRLEVINVNGNQSVGPMIVVEAGKTYEITIHYGDRTEFSVKLLSDLSSKVALKM